MLDNITRIAFYNGLVLLHLDYTDTVWGDQPGLKSEMQKLPSVQKKDAKKIELGKMSSVGFSGLEVFLTDVPPYKLQSKETFRNILKV